MTTTMLPMLDVITPRRITMQAYIGNRPVASVCWQGWDDFDATWPQTLRSLHTLFGEGVLSWAISVSARTATQMGGL
jgi:hypothetical protein